MRRRWVKKWRGGLKWTDEKRPRLDLFHAGSIVLITDTRACARQGNFVLTGLDAKIYLGCDTAQTPRSVVRQIGDSFSEEDIRARLESFRDARLMVEMDGHYLSLAVWRNRTARDGGERAGDASRSEITIAT